MDKESKRQTLVRSLKDLTPEMKETLRKRKEEGRREMERPDFVWHLLLQSFATLGGSRGWEGLIGNQDNYRRVTFDAISRLGPEERFEEILETFRTAKIRYAKRKAPFMARNYERVAEMGGPEEAKKQAFTLPNREAKLAFMKQFDGIGDKYARNIWMDSYHPDFHNSVAIDLRIKKVTEALGYSFANYAEHERFYQDIAKEAGLQGWELDRLLYNHRDEFLAVVS